MEPWLDELSDEWNSNKISSSPGNSSKLFSSRTSNSQLQSRIPHLSQDSSNGGSKSSFLRPRSVKGLSRSLNQPALSELSSSRRNAPKTDTSGRSNIPRRESSDFSGSVNSVQRHTIERGADLDEENIPEWKRRLTSKQPAEGDSCDLFGPTPLEGIFKKPASKGDSRVQNQPSNASNAKLWSMPDEFQSMRASRSRLPELEVLAEEDEDEGAVGDSALDESEIVAQIADSILDGEPVNDGVPQFQEEDGPQAPQLPPISHGLRKDSRLRTCSGQEEIHNEEISPITSSKQNTIRESVLRYLQEHPPSRSDVRSNDEGVRCFSSDDSVLQDLRHRAEEDVGEITSHSLPDDLSMGTQDFMAAGGFINTQRGVRPSETFFKRKPLDLSQTFADDDSALGEQSLNFRSSPPPYKTDKGLPKQVNENINTSPKTPKKQQEPESSDRPRSSGSPLKLFGHYDTFTTDKLLRRLSQFQSEGGESREGSAIAEEAMEAMKMRISHFGQGDLDDFAFEQRTEGHGLTVASGSFKQSMLPVSKRSKLPPLRPSKSYDSALDTRSAKPLDFSDAEEEWNEAKRLPSSIRDRTPKRRRTLVISEGAASNLIFQLDQSRTDVETNQVAGKKRKDARYEKSDMTADPSTLANRPMLRPRQKSGTSSRPSFSSSVQKEEAPNLDEAETKLAEELADELASFGHGFAKVATDLRKPSVTTKDFINEATKIMQFIRQKGKPTRRSEDARTSSSAAKEVDLNPDSILDLELDADDSTVDSFSRPPSRNGSVRKRKDRMPLPTPEIASQLQKYQDHEDLDLVLTSRLGTLHLPGQKQHESEERLPEDDQEDDRRIVSSPSNIRIMESVIRHQRQPSTSGAMDPQSLPTQGSSASTNSRSTIPTSSSGSSGNKGRIPPGMVPVPEQIGAMTFDHLSKTWVREKVSRDSPASRKSGSDEDPFGDIPDLSVGESEADKSSSLASKTHPRNAAQEETTPASGGNSKAREPRTLSSDTLSKTSKQMYGDSTAPQPDTRATSWSTSALTGRKLSVDLENRKLLDDHAQEVEHEMRIHDGWASEAPPSPQRVSRKVRVVTIGEEPAAPIASPPMVHEDEQDSETSNLVEEEEQIDLDSSVSRIDFAPAQDELPKDARAPPVSRKLAVGRPVSRIDEEDEENENGNLSMVHVSHPGVVTPANRKPPAVQAALGSLIYLTPLSEFSVHQTDRAAHHNVSYIAERAHPNALLHAHGPLSLAVDRLMQAITDAEPYELYWEHIRRLDVHDRNLDSLHRLDEYCASVEELRASDNHLTQVAGIPSAVRTLHLQNNQLSSLTSWSHLYNLQYLDISANGLQNLDGLSCLQHLRELKANGNQIQSLRGILHLDGLLSIEARDNELTAVDFGNSELHRLQHLDLSGNRLTSVANAHHLRALRSLYVEKNQLSRFAHRTGPFANLRDLRLSCNRLESIDLASFPMVENLYLDSNSIRDVRGLEISLHLETLSLRDQSKSPHLLDLIFSTPNECRKLYLSSNPVSSDGLKLPTHPHLNLKYLELAACGLTSLPRHFGRKIPNCRILNLNFNALQKIQSLGSCVRMNKLMVAGNRLNRLRRTCMTLTKLSVLTKVDMRDNPLTIGFYPPHRDDQLVLHGPSNTVRCDRYSLPPVDAAADGSWTDHLDDGTRMKRRTIELFVATGCQKLCEMDGLAIDRDALLHQDNLWAKLTQMGIIAKVEGGGRGISAQGMVRDEDEDDALPLNAEVGG